MENLRAFLIEAKKLGILGEVVEVVTKGYSHKSTSKISAEKREKLSKALKASWAKRKKEAKAK